MPPYLQTAVKTVETDVQPTLALGLVTRHFAADYTDPQANVYRNLLCKDNNINGLQEYTAVFDMIILDPVDLLCHCCLSCNGFLLPTSVGLVSAVDGSQ